MNYLINYEKSNAACSIIWESEDHKISQLDTYIYAIQCADGENIHALLSSEWPHAEGKNDFETLELGDFEAIEGDMPNEYLLCFYAEVEIDLDSHPLFKEALESSDNMVIARVQFKNNGSPIVDSDGNEEYLYEMSDDNFVELEDNDF